MNTTELLQMINLLLKTLGLVHTINLSLDTADISKIEGAFYITFRGELYGEHTSEELMGCQKTSWENHSQRLDNFPPDSDSEVANLNEQFKKDLSLINKENGKFIVTRNWRRSADGSISTFYSSTFLVNDQVVHKEENHKNLLDLLIHIENAREHIIEGKLNQYFQDMRDGKLQYGESSIGESMHEKLRSKTFRKTPEGKSLVKKAQTFFNNVPVGNMQPEVQSAIARLNNYGR